jgi:single-strand DNA-binding protein
MNETYVTLSGWLGGDVTLRNAGGVPVASFRLASTPRRYVRKTDTWENGDTQWYAVTAWRALAENCDRSLLAATPWWSTASSARACGPTGPGWR